MKNSFKLFVAALAVVGFAGTASAQGDNTSSATGTAVARIIEPITLSATDGWLRFGNIVTDADGGSVTIYNPAGQVGTPTVTYNGVAKLDGWYDGPVLAGATNAVTSGNFTVTGEPGFHYIIDIPSSVSLVAGEGSTMTCNLYNPYHDVLVETIIGNVGTAYFGVGGELIIGEDQYNGVYSTTFPCTVSYE